MQLSLLGRTQRLKRHRCDLDHHSRRFHRHRRSSFLSPLQIAEDLNVSTSTMQSQWFVIHTLSGQEQKVKESIEKRIKSEEMGDYIKEVMVPMEKVVEVRNQKKTVSTRK